ncbi:type II toxin-antitoxin system MqsA family antitoxin [Nostoc sp. C117]|uniref:type II toxin-antitoxin system MqsA family antitoxin n=1 Tax=Nostoc sp. C117 TaxID=3349875 RepID=UPI00370DAD91
MRSRAIEAQLLGKMMKCVICQHGETKPALVTVTLEQDECIIVLKKVPAEICDNCGEYYLSDAVTEQVLEKADLAVNNGTELEIIRYAL